MSNQSQTAVQPTPIQQLDRALQRYAQLQSEGERLAHNKRMNKMEIENLVREHNLGGHQVAIEGQDKDVKVSLNQKQVRVLDVNELSVALGVSVADAKKKDVLMRAVAEGRLTLADYEGFHYYEPQDKISVRRVKAGN